MRKMSLLATLLLCGTSWSHEFLTEMLVFSDDYAVNPYHVAVSYELSEEDLLTALHVKKSKYELGKLVKRSGSSNPREFKKVGATDCDFESEGMNKTCGVFDHFSASRSVAIDMCNAYALSHAAEYPHGLVPQFTAPNTFTDGSTASINHHTAYKYEHGLKFNCVELLLKKAPYSVRK
ncbi:hypothetical protein [Marinicella rhabdoformis]|uniref:hypothetical protein n=1 Tax=Marinicella rhabdoformis TaxID=2580566 RepID=UPI0012AEC14A|nr:hypothetical protein [Marinicella rhabdoformis]